MREDLVVPGEGEENYVLARDARVVTIPFSPLEERMQKEKPEVFERLQKLKAIIAEPAPKPEPRVCPYCKSEIADDATRCPHCTSHLE